MPGALPPLGQFSLISDFNSVMSMSRAIIPFCFRYISVSNKNKGNTVGENLLKKLSLSRI
jgi:hypothetical protein